MIVPEYTAVCIHADQLYKQNGAAVLIKHVVIKAHQKKNRQYKSGQSICSHFPGKIIQKKTNSRKQQRPQHACYQKLPAKHSQKQTVDHGKQRCLQKIKIPVRNQPHGHIIAKSKIPQLIHIADWPKKTENGCQQQKTHIHCYAFSSVLLYQFYIHILFLSSLCICSVLFTDTIRKPRKIDAPIESAHTWITFLRLHRQVIEPVINSYVSLSLHSNMPDV